jgi:hypothetical protein
MIHQLKRLLTIVVVLVCALATSLPAHAQQDRSGSGLSISPTISEFTLKTGQADKLDITLKNITVGDITAKALVNDFKSDNLTGNPQIITDPNKTSTHSIKKFVLGLEDIPLAKGERKKVTVALQVPDKTPPGAYFGVIRYKAIPAGANAPKEGEVTLSASVGTIVLITVPGNLKQQIQLSTIHIYRGKHEGTLFASKPTDAGIEIRNLGNGFSQPFGTVTVDKMFGGQVYSYQLNATSPRAHILPGSSRIFKNRILNISQPGRYTVTANVTSGTGGDVLVQKKTFWYVPLWLLLVVAAVIIFLIWLATRAYRGTRSRRRR